MLNIKDITPFMLNDKNLIHFLNNKNSITKASFTNKEKQIIPKPQNNISDNFFNANQTTDTLIWYYHILLNGIQSYHFLSSNSYEEENKIKINLVYKIRENKQILKNHKIKYREIEEQSM